MDPGRIVIVQRIRHPYETRGALNSKEQKRLLIMNEVVAGRKTDQEAMDMLGITLRHTRRRSPLFKNLWLSFFEDHLEPLSLAGNKTVLDEKYPYTDRNGHARRLGRPLK